MTKEYVNLYDVHGRSLGATNEWQRVPDAFDYIIFKKGDVVKAKNGRTGRIELKGAEIGSIVNSIFDSIGKYEGINILIKRGIYPISEPITINAKTHWELYFEKGARIARGKSGEEGLDAGLDDYVIKVTGDVREDNENFAIINPQINNAKGGIRVDCGAWFSILNADIRTTAKEAIVVNESNSFIITVEELLGGKPGTGENVGIYLGKEQVGGTGAVNYGLIQAFKIAGFDKGIRLGNGNIRWARSNIIAAGIEACTDGIYAQNYKKLHLFHCWFENNDTAIHSYNTGTYGPAGLVVEKCVFEGNTKLLVIDKYFDGNLCWLDEAADLSGVKLNGPEIAGRLYLPAEPGVFNSNRGAVLIINGVGREAAGPGNPPSNSNWKAGDIVENTDDGTIWLKRSNGT